MHAGNYHATSTEFIASCENDDGTSIPYSMRTPNWWLGIWMHGIALRRILYYLALVGWTFTNRSFFSWCTGRYSCSQPTMNRSYTNTEKTIAENAITENGHYRQSSSMSRSTCKLFLLNEYNSACRTVIYVDIFIASPFYGFFSWSVYASYLHALGQGAGLIKMTDPNHLDTVQLFSLYCNLVVFSSDGNFNKMAWTTHISCHPNTWIYHRKHPWIRCQI